MAQGILGAALVNEGVAPLASAAGAAYGPLARVLMLAAAAASMFGNLSGAVLAGPRSIFALGRDSFLPRVLASVHPVHRTPHVAVLSFAAAALAIGLSGSFEQLAILVNLSVLAVYFVIALAAWRLRVLNVRLEGEPFGLPGGPLIPVLAWSSSPRYRPSKWPPWPPPLPWPRQSSWSAGFGFGPRRRGRAVNVFRAPIV